VHKPPRKLDTIATGPSCSIPLPLSDGAQRFQPQHPISEIANVREVKLEHLKQLLEVSEEPPQAIVPRVLALELSVPQLEDRIWLEVLQVTLDVPPVEGLSGVQKPIDVLLRHRLLR
jgi:hypothetical protein